METCKKEFEMQRKEKDQLEKRVGEVLFLVCTDFYLMFFFLVNDLISVL